MTTQSYDQIDDRSPPLRKLIRSGLPFIGHKEFKKADIEARQELYVAIAKQVWTPGPIASSSQQ